MGYPGIIFIYFKHLAYQIIIIYYWSIVLQYVCLYICMMTWHEQFFCVYSNHGNVCNFSQLQSDEVCQCRSGIALCEMRTSLLAMDV